MTTTVTLIAGVQLTLVETAQARFEPERRTEQFQVCQVTSGYLEKVTCSFNQTEEKPPNASEGGGGR
ncbi:MAG: hypothetical protein VKK42_04445 [Lyngbya sp.]|nr:hypothetical protein [Lyngbya sp.]